MLRLFTCVWMPGNIRKKTMKFQEKIKRLPIEAKFVEPENLHFTVTFLGNKEPEILDKIKRGLDEVTKNVKKFHVKIEGLKLIPNENFIRVIGVEIKDEKDQVADLIKSVASFIDGKFYEKQKLTLCRVKNVYDKKSMKIFIKKNRNVKLGSFDVESVALVKSTLTKKGPIYKTIYESPLK